MVCSAVTGAVSPPGFATRQCCPDQREPEQAQRFRQQRFCATVM